MKSTSKERPRLWLLLSSLNDMRNCALIPSLAWIAEEKGIAFEAYLESHRSGELFAATGSTVLSGHHYSFFNYLHAVYDVSYIKLGSHGIFESSTICFGKDTIAASDSVYSIYEQLGIDCSRLTVIPDTDSEAGRKRLIPYLYQEIYFGKKIAIPSEELNCVRPEKLDSLGLDIKTLEKLKEKYCFTESLAVLSGKEDFMGISSILAERSVSKASGVAFGDPDAIMSMLPSLCREKRVAVYAPCSRIPTEQVKVSSYTESISPAAPLVRSLVEKCGNRVISGRQSSDGDLFEWSKNGICIQIIDPDRPVFPVIRKMKQPWTNIDSSIYEFEPDDAQLEKYADEGRILSSLAVHSGEMAHNEAMLNLVDLCITNGFKIGIGTHVGRLESCPQLWELISIDQEKGGALGLVEMLLHSGGMGVMAENSCPPAYLEEHVRNALDVFDSICGKKMRPLGYLSFMDSDMETFTELHPEIYQSLSRCGLNYSISCALPGRNKVLWTDGFHSALNQSSRCICTGSPYVRISSVDDINYKTPLSEPGWYMGVIDAPVVAFNPYIWRHGNEFMKLVDTLTDKKRFVNVLPHTVARYAAILKKRGIVPSPV